MVSLAVGSSGSGVGVGGKVVEFRGSIVRALGHVFSPVVFFPVTRSGWSELKSYSCGEKGFCAKRNTCDGFLLEQRFQVC
jgi:hypothetical protein